jgi:hypothetical protein
LAGPAQQGAALLRALSRSSLSSLHQSWQPSFSELLVPCLYPIVCSLNGQMFFQLTSRRRQRSYCRLTLVPHHCQWGKAQAIPSFVDGHASTSSAHLLVGGSGTAILQQILYPQGLPSSPKDGFFSFARTTWASALRSFLFLYELHLSPALSLLFFPSLTSTTIFLVDQVDIHSFISPI